LEKGMKTRRTSRPKKKEIKEIMGVKEKRKRHFTSGIRDERIRGFKKPKQGKGTKKNPGARSGDFLIEPNPNSTEVSKGGGHGCKGGKWNGGEPKKNKTPKKRNKVTKEV